MTKKINQYSEEIIKDLNGNIESIKTNTSYKIEGEPPYVKLYLDTILYLKDLPKSHNPVLLALLKRIPWANQDQDIPINAALKRKISSELNCSVSRINNAITDFVKGQVLFRVDKGLYQFNPHLFGRGDWRDINELRLNITFNANGKTISGEINKIPKSKKTKSKCKNNNIINLSEILNNEKKED